MATFGYGQVGERPLLGFAAELKEGPWAAIATKKFDGAKSAADLLQAPQPVVWKLRLDWGIASVLATLGATTLVELDADWDAAQRRFFHVVAAGRDDKEKAVRDAADRLAAGLLSGAGTAQTGLSLDDEVDFGRTQIAATAKGGPLAADAEKVKVGPYLADIAKTTETLAAALGRSNGGKRKPPSKQLRDAVAECANTFNSVHDDIAWFIAKTPPGAERDTLVALLKPMEDLLERNAPAAAPPATKGGASGESGGTAGGASGSSAVGGAGGSGTGGTAVPKEPDKGGQPG